MNINIPNKNNIEYEIKIGKFTGKHWDADVSTYIFNLIYNYVKGNKPNHTRSLICKGDIRIEYFLNDVNEVIREERMIKNNIENQNDYKLGIRYSVSEEIPILDKKNYIVKCFRIKDRISIKYKSWKVEFTKIFDIDPSNGLSYDEFLESYGKMPPHRLELELEYDDDFKKVNEKTKEIIDELSPFLLLKSNILHQIQKIIVDKEFKNLKNKNISEWNDKLLMTQVQNLNKESFDKIKINYSVTDKADGDRYLLYVDNQNHLLLDKTFQLSSISKAFTDDGIYLLDIEKIGDLVLIFDCLIFDGKDTTSEYLEDRLNKLKKLKLNKNFKIKEFYWGEDIFPLCKKVYCDTKYPYHLDGLIFTPTNKGYRTDVYKWKPPNEQTIDFLIDIVDSSANSYFLNLYVSAPKHMVKHYNKNKFKMFYKSKFLPYLLVKGNRVPLRNKDIKIESGIILEMNYNFKSNQWMPYRFREDKTAIYKQSLKTGQFEGPNGFNTAKRIRELLQKPITLDMITTGQVYYTGVNRDKTIIKAMLDFNNHVKRMMYNKYLKSGMSLLELAGGRGGDLFKFMKKNPKFVLLTDIAKDGLREGERRLKNSEFKNKNVVFKEYDLRNNVSSNIKKYSKGLFDVISCQFAIHYFLASKEMLNNFYNNVNENLKENGIFMFTCFDGKNIEEVLYSINKNKKLEYIKNNKTIMSLARHYNKNNKQVFGREISVYVETIGEHSKEYLVDLDYLLNYFVDGDYEVLENISFNKLLNTYKGPKLSDAEKKFTGMYNSIVLKKL